MKRKTTCLRPINQGTLVLLHVAVLSLAQLVQLTDRNKQQRHYIYVYTFQFSGQFCCKISFVYFYSILGLLIKN